MAYLLDSNVIIDSISNKLPKTSLIKLKPIVDDQFLISVISKIEILGFDNGSEQINANYRSFVDTAVVFELSPEIVHKL